MSDVAPPRRQLPPTPDWLTGVEVHLVHDREDHSPIMRCRQCGELLCTIDPVEPMWVLADVARDHRQWCRDRDERSK